MLDDVLLMIVTDDIQFISEIFYELNKSLVFVVVALVLVRGVSCSFNNGSLYPRSLNLFVIFVENGHV